MGYGRGSSSVASWRSTTDSPVRLFVSFHPLFMDFIYLDLRNSSTQCQGHSILGENVISNRDDITLSPIVLWSKVVEESKAVKEIVVVCEDSLRSEYETLCMATHLQNVRILPVPQIPDYFPKIP